ncbi:unnamed protein product [Brassica oleracea]
MNALISLVAYPTNNTQQTVLDSGFPVHRFIKNSSTRMILGTRLIKSF